MRRREFLLTTSWLMLSPSALFGQQTTKPASDSDTVFADFESGTYDGWTLTGDCWGDAPASDVTFRGKITGFQGKRFLCTLHPTLGNKATGKAVSKEFTIEKPFINFLIGGGNYPGEACLNLMVDGKVLRTETGNDSAELRQASWDVSLLKGKTAHFEIVDKTQSPDRGYIMTDEILFAALPRDRSLLDIESGPMLRQFGIDPYFLPRSRVTFTPIWGKGDLAPLFDFGVTPRVFKELVNSCCVGAYRTKHDPNRTVEQTAHLLAAEVTRILTERRVESPSSLLKQWMTAEAICAYVFSNLKFDAEGEKNHPNETYALQERPFQIFAMPNPKAFCSGFSKITTELAYHAGLKCCTINGVCRWNSGKVVHEDGHSWVMFDFGDNIRVPADVTPMHPMNASSDRVNSKIDWHCLPCTPRAWELVMRMHWPHIVRFTPEGPFLNGGVPQIADRNQHNPNLDITLYDCTWDEWAAINARPYWDLEAWYMDRTYKVYGD